MKKLSGIQASFAEVMDLGWKDVNDELLLFCGWFGRQMVSTLTIVEITKNCFVYKLEELV